MEDRFKFRAWDTEEKEMNYFQNKRGMQYNNDEIRISNDWDGYDNPKYWGGDYDDYVDRTDKYILMQCTGIKDVKGNLIYEGDILQHPQLPHKVVVEWFQCGFWLNGYQNGAKRNLHDVYKFYEVIGNIYDGENKNV